MKVKECGYLPGGYNQYYQSLVLILGRLRGTEVDYKSFKHLLVDLFPQIRTDRTIKGIINYIKGWDFVKRDKKLYSLTEMAEIFYANPSKIKLFFILCEKILLFEELFDLMKRPKTIEELLLEVNHNYALQYDLKWSTTKQIKHRIDFYLGLGFITKLNNGKYQQSVFVEERN